MVLLQNFSINQFLGKLKEEDSVKNEMEPHSRESVFEKCRLHNNTICLILKLHT